MKEESKEKAAKRDGEKKRGRERKWKRQGERKEKQWEAKQMGKVRGRGKEKEK